MKIRLMGLPAELDQAVEVLRRTPELDIVEVSGPYPNRGDSRMVRAYLEAMLNIPGQDGEAP